MKTITSIKKKGKKDLYAVSLDGEVFGVLSLEVIYKHSLSVGKEVSEKELGVVMLESQKILAFENAIDHLSKSLKTEKELISWLRARGYMEEASLNAISKLKSYGYLSDSAYADAYVRTYKKNKGKKLLKMEMLARGVPNDIVGASLENLENQKDEALSLAKKYYKGKEDTRENKAKLYRFLSSKGFESDDVKFAIQKVCEVSDEDWN